MLRNFCPAFSLRNISHSLKFSARYAQRGRTKAFGVSRKMSLFLPYFNQNLKRSTGFKGTSQAQVLVEYVEVLSCYKHGQVRQGRRNWQCMCPAFVVVRSNACRGTSPRPHTARSRLHNNRLTIAYEHAVTQLAETPSTCRKVAGSIPDGVIGIFH